MSLRISPVQSATSSVLGPCPRTAKRKFNDGEDYNLKAVAVYTTKQKRSKNTNEFKSNEDIDLNLGQGLNLTIAKLDNSLLADYVAQRTKRSCPDLSLVELEDRYIPGTFGWHLLLPAVPDAHDRG